jgi:hypothetical protein
MFRIIFLGIQEFVAMTGPLITQVATLKTYIIPPDALTMSVPFYSNLVRRFLYNTGTTNGRGAIS